MEEQALFSLAPKSPSSSPNESVRTQAALPTDASTGRRLRTAGGKNAVADFGALVWHILRDGNGVEQCCCSRECMSMALAASIGAE